MMSVPSNKEMPKKQVKTYLDIPVNLFNQKLSLFRPKVNFLVSFQPVLVLQNSPWILESLGFWIVPPNHGPFQVVRLVNVLVGRKDIAHDDKVDFPVPREFDPMESKNTREKGMRIIFDVLK